MSKLYKYLLITFIIGATGFLTYQHQTDPIYRLKVGKSFNDEELRIEDWGGRFSKEEREIFLGFNTRLEDGTVIRLYIYDEAGVEVYDKPFFVSYSRDFEYARIDLDTWDTGNYEIKIFVDDELLETTTFIVEE